MDRALVEKHRLARLATPSDLRVDVRADFSAALTMLSADMFALYIKARNFHRYMSGPQFRDCHLLLDEQGERIFTTADIIAGQVSKICGATLRSIGYIARLQQLLNDDADFVSPMETLVDLRDDNRRLAALLRETHELCAGYNDFARTSPIEVWIDEAEHRTWFLFETLRQLLQGIADGRAVSITAVAEAADY